MSSDPAHTAFLDEFHRQMQRMDPEAVIVLIGKDYPEARMQGAKSAGILVGKEEFQGWQNIQTKTR
jgi:hypothetical protein